MTGSPSPRLVTGLIVVGSAVTGLLVNQVSIAKPAPAHSAESIATEQATSPQLLDLPSSWVAFEGKVRVFSPDLPERVEGRIFRAGDGSQRIETGPAGHSEPSTIDIRNIGERTHYLYAASKVGQASTWSSAPMDVPEYGGVRPPLRAADQQGLRKHPYRLSFRAGQTPSIFATDGFDVYEYHDMGGNTYLQATELNMFNLVNQSITGRREEIYDVVLGEPDNDWFVPPPGASVDVLSQKRGMVVIPRSQHRQHDKGNAK